MLGAALNTLTGLTDSLSKAWEGIGDALDFARQQQGLSFQLQGGIAAIFGTHGFEASGGIAVSIGGPGLIDAGVIVATGTPLDHFPNLNAGIDLLGGMANGNLLQRHNTQADNLSISIPPIGGYPMPAIVAGADPRDADRIVEIQVGGGYGAGISMTRSTTRTLTIYKDIVLPLRGALTNGLCAATGRC